MNETPGLLYLMSAQFLNVSCGPQPRAPVPLPQFPQEFALVHVHWRTHRLQVSPAGSSARLTSLMVWGVS